MADNQQIQKMIPDNRIEHMHGVAEWMYKHAEEYGCKNKDEMYLLGLVHDIGYLYGNKKEHEQKGAELIGLDSYYGKFVQAHGLTPQEYMDRNGCSSSEIPNEMILLWTADMMVDLSGNAVGFKARLDDIGERHGTDSKPYRICKETMTWLKNRKAIEFLTQ